MRSSSASPGTCSSSSTRRTSSTSTGPTTRTRVEALLQERPPRRSCCARSRRSTGSRGCASATRSAPLGRLRGDGEGAPAVRRHDDRPGRRAGEPRRPGGARPPPRAERDGPRATSTRSCAATASTPAADPVGQLRLRRHSARDAAAALRAAARAQGVIVRPLAGFGAPKAIRISVGTPDEHDVPRRTRSDASLAPSRERSAPTVGPGD